MLCAVSDNNLLRLKELINSQGLSSAESNGYNLLHKACECGFSEIAIYLLLIGCNVNGKNNAINPTETALHLAAKRGSTAVVKMLLIRGAGIDAVDVYHNTPLFYAVTEDRDTIVELLLSRGSRMSINECLHAGLEKMRPNLKIIQLLLSYGASMNVAMQLATFYGHKNIMILLLTKGADLNVKGRNGESLLHIACERGNISVIEFLINQGAGVNGFTVPSYKIGGYFHPQNQVCPSNLNNNGNSGQHYTLLHLAVAEKNFKVVKFLLNHGANVDAQEENGKTSLHIAVEQCYTPMVELLLSHNPDTNNKGNKNILAVSVVLNNEDSKITQLLLDYGFTVSLDHVSDRRLLIAAVRKGYLKVVQKLIDIGVNLNITTNDGLSLLHVAVCGKYKEICDLLLSNNADVNMEDKDTATPIVYAVRNGDVKITELLLSFGAQLEHCNTRYFDYGLHYAVKTKNKKMCELWIKYKADVNLKDDLGHTPILYAIKNIDYNITSLLLNNGAKLMYDIQTFNYAVLKGCSSLVELILEHDEIFDVNVNDKEGRTPLHCTAVCTDKNNILHPIIQPCIYNNILSIERKMGSKLFINNDGDRAAIAKLLLKRGADVNSLVKMTGDNYNYDLFSHDCKSFSTLFAAAENGFVQVVRCLLKNNADVNGLNFGCYTALHAAASKGHVEIVDILLKFGADLFRPTVDGCTALHFASLKGNVKVVKALIEFCLNSTNSSNAMINKSSLDLINSKDKEGVTSLMIATKIGFTSIAEILLRYGADVNVKDSNGTTALHLAAQAGCVNLISLLLKCGGDINCVTNDCLSPIDLAIKGRIEFQPRIFKCGVRAKFVNDKHKFTLQILKNHIRKLSAADLFVSNQNLLQVVNGCDESSEYKNYCSVIDCYNELDAMKKHLIAGNVSYYDIVTKSIYQVAIYTRNEIITRSVNLRTYERMFPIYSDIIHGRFKMAIKLYDLLQTCESCLNSVNSNFSELPLICIEKLFSYLSCDELQAVIIACNPFLKEYSSL